MSARAGTAAAASGVAGVAGAGAAGLQALVARGGGLGRAAQALGAALASERLAHAYLFYGPEGAGKRALALALVGAVLCADGTARADACGACRACRLVRAGTHPDFLHLVAEPGKQGLGIEQIRAAIAEFGLMPVFARGRVLLVEQAELLQPAAANALLKTLEEPPSGALLILLAARPDAVLPTVRSRCIEVRLPPPALAGGLAAPAGGQAAEQAVRWLLGEGEAAGSAPLARGERAVELLGRVQEEAAQDAAPRGGERTASKAAAAAGGRGQGARMEERRAALLIIDRLLARLRERLRAAALGGQPLGRWRRAVLRALAAARQLEGNALVPLVLSVLALDLAAILEPQGAAAGGAGRERAGEGHGAARAARLRPGTCGQAGQTERLRTRTRCAEEQAWATIRSIASASWSENGAGAIRWRHTCSSSMRSTTRCAASASGGT
ncbi:MAG: hypothetical protein KatS3mg102_0190 [Planctomycetota bacterium]|nr:MAG: hypothetical protein KatS3mg102_0190 [Planctomycetota bacterium]